MTDAAFAAHQDDSIDRAARAIEAEPFAPFSLTGVALSAGFSTYHFSRLFTARYGQSVMAYVRGRRIAAAAARLAGSNAPSLIELAFDCGFDSQEGFTRAFKRAFGVPPGRYREGERRPWMEDPMTDATSTPSLSQRPQLASRPAFRVAGLQAWFDETAKAGIPDLWAKLLQTLPSGALKGRENFGVCWGADKEGLNYIAGVALEDGAPPPAGLVLKDVPAQTYLVFRLVIDGGPLHPQMQAAMREIWGEHIPKSGYALAQGPDLEVYPPGFRPDQAGAWVEWWTPIRT